MHTGLGLATPRPVPGGSGAPFSPADVAGLVLWYDPTDNAALTKATFINPDDVVVAMVNKANPGPYDLHNGDWDGNTDPSTSPLVGAINGHQALDVFTQPGYLEVGTDLDLGASPAVTAIAVLVLDGTSSAQGQWAGSRLGTSTMQGLTPRDRSFVGAQLVDLGVWPGAFVSGTPQIRTLVRPAGTAAISAYRNGALQGTGSSGTAANCKFGFLGASSITFGASGWAGRIGEVLVYAAELDAANRGLVETYLSTKWGIALA